MTMKIVSESFAASVLRTMRFVLMLFALGVAVSCGSDDEDGAGGGGQGDGDDGDGSATEIVSTGTADGIVSGLATLKGTVNLSLVGDKEYELGFLYGTSVDGLTYGTASKAVADELVGSAFFASLSDLGSEVKYYYRAYISMAGKLYYGNVKEFKSAKITVDVRAVDLGLPSGLKWASCNVGATKPEEAGGYYAWGETETKSRYDEDNSKWLGVEYSEMQSQGVIDSKGNLTPAYDVATVKWGGTWRMPTRDEINELCNNCTWQWTTYNGVNGQLVTGPNGSSIFFPAAGTGSDHSNNRYYGYYWSATAYGSDFAYNLYVNSGIHGYMDYHRWLHGFPVRPVSE